MRSFLRQFRRAPGRILASIFALALAVGAIGVLAIPQVASSSLTDAVERDGLGDIIVETTPLDAAQLEEIASVENVRVAEAQTTIPIDSDGRSIRLIGLAADRTMDLVELEQGRTPATVGEVVGETGSFQLGDTVTVADQRLVVVGLGSTLWWSGEDVLYTDLSTALLDPAGLAGTDRLTITAVDDGDRALRAITDEVRAVIGANGDSFTDFPTHFPNGTTPIDADIRQVSQLIGLLGIFAGLVALVLLASTTNTLVTERTREVAIMRALGGRQRTLRRRLRRIAMGIALAALIVGLPLGVLISNLIARMVLEEFVGVTPGIAVDIPVLLGSAAAVMLGARLVSARAARRVTTASLATSLRDREGAPFGATRLQRVSTRLRTGSLRARIARRASLRRPARTVAVVVQIAAAVGAAFLVPSLATSVNDFNTSAFSVWQWESRAVALDDGLPLPMEGFDLETRTEIGVSAEGQIGEWEVEVHGLRENSAMIDAPITDGRWIEKPHEVVLSSGFARRAGIDVGDTPTLQLASGSDSYRVSGLTDDSSRAVYLDRDTLAADLGAPGMGNVIWSHDADATYDVGVPLDVTTLAEVRAEEAEGTNAIVVIFGAIGLVVSGVAALAVLSSMSVSLFERRHELATMQALGASRRRLRGLLMREMFPLAVCGLIGGLAIGAIGVRGIIASFESSNAIDIGVTDAVGAIPFIALGTTLMLGVLTFLVVRSAGRQPIAVNLRGAA